MRSITSITITGAHAGPRWRLLLFALSLFIAACETAPVQEMSDARQAIMVAREAGAEDLAAGELRKAEAYLESAESKLEQRAFSQARVDALAAKNSALEALSVADRAQRKTPD